MLESLAAGADCFERQTVSRSGPAVAFLAFAYLLGGGLDIKLSKHMSFRPIGIDLQYTRLQNIRDLQDRSQYNLRYQTGFNFTFGGPQ